MTIEEIDAAEARLYAQQAIEAAFSLFHVHGDSRTWNTPSPTRIRYVLKQLHGLVEYIAKPT